ncbi:hypothetical protein D9M69_512400 [compost metagenome]
MIASDLIRDFPFDPGYKSPFGALGADYSHGLGGVPAIERRYRCHLGELRLLVRLYGEKHEIELQIAQLERELCDPTIH